MDMLQFNFMQNIVKILCPHYKSQAIAYVIVLNVASVGGFSRTCKQEGPLSLENFDLCNLLPLKTNS